MEDIENLIESLSCMGVVEGRAANVIESLLAENERIRSNCYPRDGVEAIIRERDAYRAQLAKSQRRERAAVEDLTKLARKPITPCHSCSKSCVAPASLAKEYEIKWCKDWEWHGSQQATSKEIQNDSQ
jgi:hypothetical protein